MIEVLSSGMYTSVQDQGRYGFRKMGVPLSGAMDQYHAQFANKLIGNSSDDAVLECTLLGPKLRFDTTTEIAICGAVYQPSLNNKPCAMNRLLRIQKGSVLALGSPSNGMRGYIAMKGGISTAKIMGSRSMYQPITAQSRLATGDVILIKELKGHTNTAHALLKTVPTLCTSEIIATTPGPEYSILSKSHKEQLVNTLLMVTSESNRMGILLDGLNVSQVNEIITAPIQPGTVQLTPSGKCIVVMRDAQTTGGYARVLQLNDRAINNLAQKRPGEMVRFQLEN